MKGIGHTSSGKPVYAAFQLHRGFADWSANDHNDAADMHRKAARSDIKTNVSMHENSATLHEEEAQRIYKLVQKLGLAPRASAPAKPRRNHSTRKSPAQLDREIAQALGTKPSRETAAHATKAKGSSWKEIAADYKRRARSAERAGGKVVRYPHGAMLILPTKDSDEYYYEDWQADDLIDRTKRENKELLEDISLEDLLLAQSQNW